MNLDSFLLSNRGEFLPLVSYDTPGSPHHRSGSSLTGPNRISLDWCTRRSQATSPASAKVATIVRRHSLSNARNIERVVWTQRTFDWQTPAIAPPATRRG